jgi:hypothetical protein
LPDVAVAEDRVADVFQARVLAVLEPVRDRRLDLDDRPVPGVEPASGPVYWRISAIGTLTRRIGSK